MAKRRKKKEGGPQHVSVRLAADVVAIIAQVKQRTGWPERQVIEEFMRAAQAVMNGEGSAGRALGELLNAAHASHQTALRAEGMARLARTNVRAAHERLRKLTGKKAPPPLRQSA